VLHVEIRVIDGRDARWEPSGLGATGYTTCVHERLPAPRFGRSAFAGSVRRPHKPVGGLVFTDLILSAMANASLILMVFIPATDAFLSI
jgi:hypothetical protein